MEEKNEVEIINLREIFIKLWSAKSLFLKVWGVTFVLACAWIFPQPRTYETSVMLAPESSELASGGSLSDIASSFGINIGGMTGFDAIYPMLYPDVISSNDFIVGLLDIPVKTADGEVNTDFLTYLLKHQKKSFWSYPGHWLKKAFESMTSDADRRPIGADGKLNPYRLSRKEESLVESLRKSIDCSIDKKTEVITITVVAQDPLVCAIICDSVRVRLQDFITSYRTSKARNDVDYYTRMSKETYKDYQQALEAYGHFCDTHVNMSQQTAMSRRDELENDVQMTLNTYNVIGAQLDAAKAKVQERTPAFTVLQSVTVPPKPSGPKRMLFVIAMLFLATFATGFYIMFLQNIRASKSE